MSEPAAFRRLCVETCSRHSNKTAVSQPPSGGCVLKHQLNLALPAVSNQPPSGGCVLKQIQKPAFAKFAQNQPPSGGCVLKHAYKYSQYKYTCQPPSGGCVLKPSNATSHGCFYGPAAFRRLCVETLLKHGPKYLKAQPPSGGCVLKPRPDLVPNSPQAQPPSGGCVLKHYF